MSKATYYMDPKCGDVLAIDHPDNYVPDGWVKLPVSPIELLKCYKLAEKMAKHWGEFNFESHAQHVCNIVTKSKRAKQARGNQ